MKRYLKISAYFYAAVSIVFLLTAFVIKRNLNIDVKYIYLTLCTLLTALLLALSYIVFKCKKGNALLNIIISYLIIFPILFILRSVFDILIFRFSFVIYLFGLVCTILYIVVVLAVSAKSKACEKDLNSLLGSRNNGTDINKDKSEIDINKDKSENENNNK